ncbi:hypothetical protein FS837_002988 [Tulasnella sp. UAMH 9824]|nr:hypothetical protein FS837_002988 [Tulasnella sp. UAMH 9824]
MAYLEDVQTRKQRAIMSAEVADIYQQYVYDLIKPEQDAVDACTGRMIEFHARMETSKQRLEELGKLIHRRIDQEDSEGLASENRELTLLIFEVWLLMTGWLGLFEAREAAEERIRDLEWERNQVIETAWANIGYAITLARERGSSRIFEAIESRHPLGSCHAIEQTVAAKSTAP